MTGFGITTIPIGVYFDKEARRLQKCIMLHFGKTDFHRCSMLHRQERINPKCEVGVRRLRTVRFVAFLPVGRLARRDYRGG